MTEILENIRAAFVPFTFIDALEIILYAFIFYYVFRILKNSNVRFMIALFTVLVIVTGVIFVFNTELNGEVFMVVPILLAGMVLILFNVEVKRDILGLNSINVLAEKPGHQAAVSKEEVARYVSEIIKALLVANDAESETYTGYNEITSKARISDGDYIENLAYVGRRLDGTPMIIIFKNALVSGGLSVNGQNKTAGTTTVTFECVADLTGDFDVLPYTILYPTPETA